jgi:hypothetical protein
VGEVRTTFIRHAVEKELARREAEHQRKRAKGRKV